MKRNDTRLEVAFASLTSESAKAVDALVRFQAQMRMPPRAYHTEAHVEAVLQQVYARTGDNPSISLVAAALYHDVIYDAARPDNELASAVVCHEALTALNVAVPDIGRATHLILETQFHRPPQKDRDAVLLVDADLHILGSAPDEYAAYIAAIRTEYAHVADPDWRVGRKAVVERFLQRERIYSGDWEGRTEREAAARENIAREIAALS